MRRQSLRPGKTEFKLAFFIGILFTCIGLSLIIGALVTPLPIMFLLPFGLLFTAISAFNTYRAFKNCFTEEGMAYYEITAHDEQSSKLQFDEKLRRLEALKSDGLITETEYTEKRKEILVEKW